MTNDTLSDIKEADLAPEKISPSGFMRKLRPEFYSDTEDQVSYVLDAATFDHHLETITSRNQTHEFEVFLRKLCERAICPNLRPQTGPEGGGDSKVDTESYPVADEITCIYVGEANSGRERWGFAFSAKKKWAEKVRKDVAEIVGTGRTYDRVICVTSRAARSKDRSRLEQELTNKYGVSITIHDRSWIMAEIIEKDRKDLACNYLGVGQAKSDPLRLGPADYSRARQLAAIEKSLDDPEAFQGMERQRVTEALVAAKLSRNLEQSRVKTDGRFLRAIRLANEDGTYRQKLEARYEHIWTGFWWFDDVALVNDSYSAFEAIALTTDHAANLEFLCNLYQLLTIAVVHRLLSREESRLDERTATLRGALEKIAANKERPNNSLEAQASLLIVRLDVAMIDGRREDLPDIWREYSGALDRAKGLGEFKADRLVRMIDSIGNVAGNDPAYNELVEKLADFVSERTGEADGALILLKRAQQLDIVSDRIDIIRLLGKATIALSKKEYAEHLIEALHLLMIAYRGAGLLWAARATCIMAAASIVIEGEEDSYIPANFVPTMKVLAWIALALRHIPDFLHAMQVLNGALVSLPLTEDTKELVREDLQELEYAFANVVFNLSDAELRQLESLPDILEALRLFVARMALLYTLGHEAVLREDGSLPQEATDDDVKSMLSMMASQPFAKETQGPLILNGDGPQLFSASILGMTVELSFEGRPHLIPVAEMVLGSLEAFFATAIDQRVMPHTEKFRLKLIESADLAEPRIEMHALDMSAALTWPAGLSVVSYDSHRAIRKSLAELSGQVMAATCMVGNVSDLLDKLYGDEAVDSRMALIAAAPTSHHRLTSKHMLRMSEWQDVVRKEYPLKTPRPQLEIVDLKQPESDYGGGDAPDLTDHRAMRVHSVIDAHAWDQADWKGAAYLNYGPGQPPGIALMFEDKNAARKIFERWRERFGNRDSNEEIYLAIIRNLPAEDPLCYVMMVTSKLPDAAERDPKLAIFTTCRTITMTPDSPANLQHFLDAYRDVGAFYLLPTVIVDGALELMPELAILKHDISIKDAASIGRRDIEVMGLRTRGWATHSRSQARQGIPNT
jgi:hypothetical protein